MAIPSSQINGCEVPPPSEKPAFPTAGGSGGRGVTAGSGGAAVGVEVASTVDVDVAVGDPAGVDVADPVGVAVADPVGDGLTETVAVGVGVVDAGATSFVTVDSHLTSVPPPLPEPLHWSMFTGRVDVIVDPAVTVQRNSTLVPPLPEPLHCPTVAAVTEVIPGVFTGLQNPGAPVPSIEEPMHW